MFSTVPSGSIVGFQARDALSDTINIMSWSLPGWGIHHVGIMGLDGLLYESCGSHRPPCVFTGKTENGVGARPLEQIIEYLEGTDTKLWVYPLRSPLYQHEEERLREYLNSLLRTEYDLTGALHAGGGLLYSALCKLLKEEDLSSLFCSEMVASCMIEVGRLISPSASWWAPNKLCRFSVRSGMCDKPFRVR